MRVLHVIDSGRPLLREFARPRLEESFDDRVLACRELITQSVDLHDHRVCVLGSGRAAKRAGVLGLAPHAVVSTVKGWAHLSVDSVSGLVRAVRPDLVHWWNGRWTGGCFGRPGRAWRLESMLGSTPMKIPLWLSGGGALVCGPAEKSAATAADLRPFEVPAPAFPGTPGSRVADEPAKVLLLGPGADSREFLFMCGLIWGAGSRLTAIVSASSAAQGRTRRVGRTFQYPVRVITSDAIRADLLSQCAAAVWMGPARPDTASPGVAIGSALAAGVPVAVPFEAEWAIPEPLRPKLVAKNTTANELARVLINILGGPIDLGSAPPAEASNRAFVHAALEAYEGRAISAPTRPSIARTSAA